jgi:hypothetical protein
MDALYKGVMKSVSRIEWFVQTRLIEHKTDTWPLITEIFYDNFRKARPNKAHEISSSKNALCYAFPIRFIRSIPGRAIYRFSRNSSSATWASFRMLCSIPTATSLCSGTTQPMSPCAPFFLRTT